jgi:type I restriction enzyme S subunit
MLGMIGEGKTRGQVAILDIYACHNQNSAAIRVSETGLPGEFVYYFLFGRYEETRQGSSGNNQPALNKSRVENILIPLPPLAEQHSIVAEVERRLSLIDQLEKTIEADLARANRLRQSILKRAFAGQLVPQDPNDEPASVLLERLP